MELNISRVVNGKVCNTNKAQRLAKVAVEDCHANHLADEYLYRRRTGGYFLCICNEITGEISVKSLSLSDATAWGEKRLDSDQYQEIFGDIEEGAESGEELNQQVSILLPVSMYEALKAKKTITGTNVSALIIKALRNAGY